jgi:enamine deaminase RidA (YjgF/YER057c/UK114 family)
MDVLQPEGWPRPKGYANGIAARGRVIAVAGQVGWDPRAERMVSDEFAAQAGQALRNVAAILAAGGAQPAHVVRLTWYVTDREAYLRAQEAVGREYRAVFGAHYPAMTLVVVAALLEPGAKVEIEATAVSDA